MANPTKLSITYHPARREILFKVFEDNTPITKQYETLEKYSVYQKGKFVLNLCGNDFFRDILKPFSGKDSVEVSLRTTKLDFEDFNRQVIEYNKKRTKNECEIKLLPLGKCNELVDMKSSFNAVKEQGTKIVELLDKHWNNIQNIKCTSNNAKAYLMNVAKKIEDEKNCIESNLNSLAEDNNVNLCLIGVHSSGKSTLINALLGYKILPVDILPETAKMIKIKGVPDIESSFIVFSKDENGEEKKCKICWDKNSKSLVIKDANIANDYLDSLLSELQKNEKLKIHKQLYKILGHLNGDKNVNACIDLGFPIPFNSKDLQFTIYDTPGADSNVGYHKKILSEALENQTNSILLFVLLPNSLSGSGNIELMNELLEKSEKSNNLIDIEQSFFVFNWADSSNAELDKIKDGKLKKSENDTSPINLSERKVFFLSSRCGFAAIATKNKVAESVEANDFKYKCSESYDEKFGRYYRHNHYGKSGYATNQMIQNTDLMLKKSKYNWKKYYIASGVYTLVEEIKNYGERYASAVKTSAIIKSIETAADSVYRMVQETELGTDEKVKDIQDQLEAEIHKVEEVIDSTSKKYIGRAQLPSETEKIGVGSQFFEKKILDPVKDVLDKRLERFLLFFSVHIDEQMRLAIQADISEIYKAYTNNYREKRSEYLQKTQSDFINDFMDLVEKSTISEETKKRLRLFKLPSIPAFGLDKKIDELFDSAKLFEHEGIKKFFRAIAKGAKFASEKINESIANNSNKEELPENAAQYSTEITDSTRTKITNNAKDILNKTGNYLKNGWKSSKEMFGHAFEAVAKGAKFASEKINESIANNSNKEELPENAAQYSTEITDSTRAKITNNAKGILNKTGNYLKNSWKSSKEMFGHAFEAVAKGTEIISNEIETWNTRTVNKEEFISAVTDWFQANQGNLTKKLKEDFSLAITQMCNDLSEEFKGNIDSYSTKIRALREDNKPLELLASDIVKLQKSLDTRKAELELKI